MQAIKFTTFCRWCGLITKTFLFVTIVTEYAWCYFIFDMLINKTINQQQKLTMKTQINQLIQKSLHRYKQENFDSYLRQHICRPQVLFATGEENNAKAASALKRNSPVQKTYNGKLPQLH